MAGLNAVALALLATPGDALASSPVRFVHAVPGAAAATLVVERAGHGAQRVGQAAFGQATPARGVASGRVRLDVRQAGRTVGHATAALRTGRHYTVVALARSRGGVAPRAYADARPRAGVAAVRVIHAAPELGAPTVRAGHRTVARRVRFGQASAVRLLAPGDTRIAALRPGGQGAPLVSRLVRLVAGRAYTELVLGSQGERTRIVALADPARRRPGTPAPAATRQRVWVVRRGDSLWTIARRQLGARASDAALVRRTQVLWSVNAKRIGTGDPNLIFTGQRLVLS